MTSTIERNRVAVQLTAAIIYSTVFVWVLPLSMLFGLGYGIADYMHYELFNIGIGVHGLAAVIVAPVFTMVFGTLLSIVLGTLIFSGVWLAVLLKASIGKLHIGGQQPGHI